MIKYGRRVAFCSPFLALTAAGACGAGTSPSAPGEVPAETRPQIRQIVVLGDSLAVSPSRAQSFPAVLQARLDELKLPWTIVNAGMGGDTASGGLRRVDALLGADVGVLILALGANDGLRGVEISRIESNLSAIIERAHARGVRVLLCGMETPPFHGWQYTLAFHRLFPRLAARYNVVLVPFLLEGVVLDPEMNGNDGIHPNAAGARRVADTVWPYLESLLGSGDRRLVSEVDLAS
jgi:acyl-CoA thioesterase-1